MFRLQIWVNVVYFSVFGSPLKMATPENLNVLFPRLSLFSWCIDIVIPSCVTEMIERISCKIIFEICKHYANVTYIFLHFAS